MFNMFKSPETLPELSVSVFKWIYTFALTSLCEMRPLITSSSKPGKKQDPSTPNREKCIPISGPGGSVKRWKMMGKKLSQKSTRLCEQRKGKGNELFKFIRWRYAKRCVLCCCGTRDGFLWCRRDLFEHIFGVFVVVWLSLCLCMCKGIRTWHLFLWALIRQIDEIYRIPIPTLTHHEVMLCKSQQYALDNKLYRHSLFPKAFWFRVSSLGKGAEALFECCHAYSYGEYFMFLRVNYVRFTGASSPCQTHSHLQYEEVGTNIITDNGRVMTTFVCQ